MEPHSSCITSKLHICSAARNSAVEGNSWTGTMFTSTIVIFAVPALLYWSNATTPTTCTPPCKTHPSAGAMLSFYILCEGVQNSGPKNREVTVTKPFSHLGQWELAASEKSWATCSKDALGIRSKPIFSLWWIVLTGCVRIPPCPRIWTHSGQGWQCTFVHDTCTFKTKGDRSSADGHHFRPYELQAGLTSDHALEWPSRRDGHHDWSKFRDALVKLTDGVRSPL